MLNDGKFAVAHAWDLKFPSAEKEVALRYAIAAKNIGAQCLQIDKDGYIINSDFETTGSHISDENDVDFVLHTHFSSFKCYDAWTIFPLWNPPKIMYDWPLPEQYMETLLQFDDYAFSTSESAVGHLNMVLKPAGLHFDKKQMLYPTLSKTQLIAPCLNKIEEPRLFYCGMAWERSANQPPRFNKLFKKLDAHDFVDFYGPRKVGDSPTWDGFKNYRKELPFDGGKSLLGIMNKAGVSLALSALVHQRAGVMSNRLFEGVAAGTLVITDRNDFVAQNFGDSVLMVDNNGDQLQTYKQVVKAFEWVRDNPEEAQEKAKKAQKIFKEKMTLEFMLENIFEKLPERKKLVNKQYFSQSTRDCIDVLVLWTANSLEEIDVFCKSIGVQSYKNLRVIFVCDANLAQSAQKILKKQLPENVALEVSPVDLFNFGGDPDDLGYRKLTTGQLLRHAYEHVESNCFTFYTAQDSWYSTHLSALKRRLDDNRKADLSYTSALRKCVSRGRISHIHKECAGDLVPSKLIAEFASHRSLGTILVKKEYMDALVEDGFYELCNFLDYTEFIPLIAKAKLAGKAELSPKTTCERVYYLGALGKTRLKVNLYEQLVYPLVMQQRAVISYLKHRVEGSIDYSVYTDISSCKAQISSMQGCLNAQPIAQPQVSHDVTGRKHDGCLRWIGRWVKERKEMWTIRRSVFWNHTEYKDANEEQLGGMSPLRHYYSIGAFVGKNPSQLFDSNYYLNANPDVARNGVNPLIHYLSYGHKEGRMPHS